LCKKEEIEATPIADSQLWSTTTTTTSTTTTTRSVFELKLKLLKMIAAILSDCGQADTKEVLRRTKEKKREL